MSTVQKLIDYLKELEKALKHCPPYISMRGLSETAASARVCLRASIYRLDDIFYSSVHPAVVPSIGGASFVVSSSVTRSSATKDNQKQSISP